MGALRRSETGGRVERRRARTRARIIDAAAEHFATHGIEGARLDAIADAADVARGTLYSHFPTKDSLVLAVMEPVLRQAAEGVEVLLGHAGVDGVEGLLRLYLDLWARHRDALRASFRARTHPLGPLAGLHMRFLRGMLALLGREASAGRLRTRDPALSGRVLAAVAVPMLELLEGHPDRERLFVGALHGLLVGTPAGPELRT